MLFATEEESWIDYSREYLG